jgi:hypothetical protein
MEGDGETVFRDECVASMVGGAERLDPCYPYMRPRNTAKRLFCDRDQRRSRFMNAIERS